jgi:hypothetical protein
MGLSGRAASLLPVVLEHENSHSSTLEQICTDADALLKAARRVGESSSGSNFGYHGELYYGDFQKPPLGKRFSVEWGGVNGISPDWKPRSPEDVKQRIESLAGTLFSKIDAPAKNLVDSARELQYEIVIELASLRDVPGATKEKELLDQLENFDWAEKIHNKYCASALNSFPNATRDSDALLQGRRLPSHTYYEAAATQADASCGAVELFWNLSKRLLRQLVNKERDSIPLGGSQPTASATVRLICERFHTVAVQLRNRREKRQTLTINDEYDVQDLLNALLRLQFDDVRPEEPTPSFGGGASRMDFLLKKEQIVVEAKMTRAALKDKELCNELIQDVARYKNHADCKKLMCLVYDPAAFIKNPNGVESDIQKLSSESLGVEAIVVPKR